MIHSKIKAMLGFAIKSQNVVFGIDNIEACRKEIHLIMADEGISPRTRLGLERLAEERKVALLIISERLEDIVFKSNCKVIAITDKNMSKNIINNAVNGGGNLIGQ